MDNAVAQQFAAARDFAEQANKQAADMGKAPAPAVTPPGASKFVGSLPLEPGRTFKAAHLQPEELAALQQVEGWKEGDPIPRSLAEAIADARKEAVTHVPSPALQNFEPGQLPPRGEQISFHDLSPERQHEILQELAVAREAAADLGEIPGAAPGVNEALRGQSIQRLNLDVAAEAAGDASLTGAAIKGPTNCPHCSWDLSQHSDIEPTTAEKMDYMQAILGSLPFTRTYALLDGALEVTFRELQQSELDMCYKTATLISGASPDSAVAAMELLERAMRCRLALQVKTIRRNGVAETFPDSLDDWARAREVAPDSKLLQEVTEYFFKHVTKNESFSRMLTAELLTFNRLVNKLEVSAHRQNFWKAT